MSHTCRIAHAAGIEGHIDDLALDVRRLPGVDIREAKRSTAIRARPPPIPLLALPCRARAHHICPVFLSSVAEQHLRNTFRFATGGMRRHTATQRAFCLPIWHVALALLLHRPQPRSLILRERSGSSCRVRRRNVCHNVCAISPIPLSL